MARRNRGAGAVGSKRSSLGGASRTVGTGGLAVGAGALAFLAYNVIQNQRSQNNVYNGPSGEFSFPSDLGLHGNYMNIRAFQSSFMNNSAVANVLGTTGFGSVFAGLGSLTSAGESINLPLPNNLSADLDPQYEKKSLTGAVSDLASGVASSASSFLGKYAGIAGAVGQVAGILGKVGAGAAGIAVNPMNVLLFTGIDFRQFSYTWKLSPKNHAESNAIRNIVNYLTWASSPGLNGGGLLLDYPHYFQLSFSKDRYLHKFQPAIIERINVNYHGQGPFYKRGDSNQQDPAPAEVELQINFQEIVIVTKNWLDSVRPTGAPVVNPTFDPATGVETPPGGNGATLPPMA